MSVTPDDIYNISEDFLVQRELLVGLGDGQFNVRERFEAVDGTVSNIEKAQDNEGKTVAGLATRVSTLETEQDKAKTDLASCANAVGTAKTAFDEHFGDSSSHVSVTLREHPDDTAVHVPSGGVENQVLVSGPGGASSTWKAVMSLLPETLTSIIENGGNVTPEQVIEAFRQITVSVWESGGLPLGADRISCSVFAGDRFFVGGQSGRVNFTFDAQVWQKAQNLFTEPTAVPVESIAYAKTADDETILVALDAYSDLRISTDKATWCPRLSVRVTTNPDGTYTDRYETADFTHVLADRGLFLLFTSKGTVYRAGFDDVIAEFNRAMESQNPDSDAVAEFDRHSTVRRMQASQESITAGVLDAASGGGYFVTVGTLGRMSISNAAVQWESVTNPFGSTNINSVAAGPDKFVAVGDDGKMGYAALSTPKSWTLSTDTPFGNEKLVRIAYGGGLWVVVSNTGKVWYSATGLAWKEAPANMVFGGTTISFGDTFFIIGDVNGNVTRSMSVAAIFSVVTRAEFAALAQELTNATEAQVERMWQAWLVLKQDVEAALARQLVLGELPGLPSCYGGAPGTLEIPLLDEHGEPILDGEENPVTVPQTKTAAYDHRHDNVHEVLQAQLGRPSYEKWGDVPANAGLDPSHTTGVPRWQDAVLLSQLDRATYLNENNDWYGRFHRFGIPVLDLGGKIFARNQTWQRGEANGLAPLDENRLVPAEFLAAGWEYETLIQAIRNQMLISWTIQGGTLFQNLGERSRINAMACGKTTIVAVGEHGKIAWGPQLDKMQLVVDGPFGRDSVVGVAHGTRPDGEEIFVAVSQTRFSVSQNGSAWSEAVDLADELQGIFFGGGVFLVPDADGNVWRSDFDTESVPSFL